MPDLGRGLLGCYRCGNVWRPRRAPVRLCPRCKSKYWDHPLQPPSRRPGRPRGLGIDEVIGRRRTALKALVSEYGGEDLRVFGSVARREAGRDSDVDLLLRFPRAIGLFARQELKERAGKLLGRKVDLATEKNLHWLIRPAVLAEAQRL